MFKCIKHLTALFFLPLALCSLGSRSSCGRSINLTVNPLARLSGMS